MGTTDNDSDDEYRFFIDTKHFGWNSVKNPINGQVVDKRNNTKVSEQDMNIYNYLSHLIGAYQKDNDE